MDVPRNVEPLVAMQQITVDTASLDQDGMLVMANGMLVGVLVHLDTPDHEQQVGNWFVEAAFGGLQRARLSPFTTLDEATRWFRQQLKRRSANI